MKSLWAFVITIFILILLALALLTGVRSIPRSLIKENVASSAEYLKSRAESKKKGSPFWSTDDFTDSLMLNIIYYNDSTSAFQQALLNSYLESEELTKQDILKELSEDKFTSQGFPSYYGRYWHGYQITLRPLLMVTDYRGIIRINIIVMIILFVLVEYLCYRKLPLVYAIALLLIFGLFYIPAGPICLQFSTCFIISLIALIILLISPQIIDNKLYGSLFFFVVGAVTSCFDLLTTPLITLGIPLLVYTGLKRENSVKRIIVLSILWGGGYVLFWSAKWILASSFTEYNIISDAFDALQFRAIGEIQDENMTRFRNRMLFIFIIFIFFGAVAFLYISKMKGSKFPIFEIIKKNMYLVVIAYYPLVWFVLFSNHSFHHIWFTYRSWSVTFFALILLLYNILYEKDSRCSALSQ